MDMDREYAIEVIDSLYPTDSQYEKTNAVGEKLLAQAKREVSGWRTESTVVLIRYAELCLEAERYGRADVDIIIGDVFGPYAAKV